MHMAASLLRVSRFQWSSLLRTDLSGLLVGLPAVIAENGMYNLEVDSVYGGTSRPIVSRVVDEVLALQYARKTLRAKG